MSLASRVAEHVLRLPPARTRDVVVQRDLPVPMRDGVTLRANRFVPRHDQHAPLVLLRTPYGRGGVFHTLGGWGRPTAERGFQTVIVSTRGTGGSGGVLDPLNERDDGLDTLAWLRAQPWYPGRFATAGPSYLGLTQWAIADAAPGELVAMVPMVTTSSFGRSHYPGGVLALEAPLIWTTMMMNAGPRGTRVVRWALARPKLRAALQRGPVAALDALATGGTVDWWQSWVTSPDADAAYWRERDARSLVAATTAQVALIAGWDDFLLPWQLDDYAVLVAAGRPPRLVIGPWVHSRGAAQVAEALAFLRAILLGDSSGLNGGPVRLYVTGANEWRDHQSWPVPGVQPAAWYLDAGGAMRTAPPAVAGASSRFRYDPADPTPNVGGPSFEGNARVRQDALIARDDVLTFTGGVLDTPLEVIGQVLATIHLRSTVAHAQVFVRLCDVDAGGRTWHICDGIERVDDSRWPASEDGVRSVRVRLRPTAHRFAAGHRLRLLIAGGAHPRYVRAYGLGEPVATATRGIRADHEVLHDPAYPTHVELPVVRGLRAA